MAPPKRQLRIAISIAGVFASGMVLAHAMLESSSPANHARLNVAPKTVELKFGHPVKLAKLTLIGDGQEIPVGIDLSAAAVKTVSIALPALKPANYHVRWSALASDGHVMTGNLDFAISGN